MAQRPDEWIHSLVERYEGPLCRYARRLTGDLERARDAVQETFLRLCRADRARLEGSERPWLYAVCRSRALDILRKERPMHVMDPSAAAVCPAPGPAEAAETRETASRLLSALDRLPEEQQEALRLKFQDGLGYREIARVTGVPESTVGYRIHAGLKTLRNTLT